MDSIDRISHLPPNITEHILQFLALKDAVRTTILSTQWRYKWSLSSQLILDRSFFNSVLEKFGQYEESCKGDGSLDALRIKFLDVVNNILFCHDEPIHNFVFHIPCWLPPEVDISHWIHFLSTKSVKQFTSLNFSKDRKLPSWFFYCGGFTKLTRLTLAQWIIPSLSTTFSGFPSLVALELQYRSHENHSGVANMVGILVSKCLLLENIGVKIYDKEGWLNIDAPRLQNLVVEGRLFGILLKETKRIKTLSILCESDEAMELFGYFPLLKKLVLGYDICLGLDTTIVADCCFEQLTTANIYVGFKAISLIHQTALECIKKILAFSPVLEVMTINLKLMTDKGKLNFAKKLLRYRRASPSAEIIFIT